MQPHDDEDTIFVLMRHGHKGFIYKDIYYDMPYYTTNLQPALFELKRWMLNEETGQLSENYSWPTAEERQSGLVAGETQTEQFDFSKFEWVDDAEEKRFG